MGHTPIPRLYVSVDPTPEEIEAERLHYLREMVAHGEMSYAEHARHVEVVLCGKQPDRDGMPFMPDPALRRSPFPSPLMETARK